MRSHFGDYRKKMAADSKAGKLDISKAKVQDGVVNRDKVKFVKKCASVVGNKSQENSAADSGFKFSFNVDP